MKDFVGTESLHNQKTSSNCLWGQKGELVCRWRGGCMFGQLRFFTVQGVLCNLNAYLYMCTMHIYICVYIYADYYWQAKGVPVDGTIWVSKKDNDICGELKKYQISPVPKINIEIYRIHQIWGIQEFITYCLNLSPIDVTKTPNHFF